jgi:signal peptidase I
MLPTIGVSGEWVLISKFHTRGREIKVGDLVSFQHPYDGRDVGVLKRVIGMPGDFVVKDPTDGTGDMLQVCSPRVGGGFSHRWLMFSGGRYQRGICGLLGIICRTR